VLIDRISGLPIVEPEFRVARPKAHAA